MKGRQRNKHDFFFASLLLEKEGGASLFAVCQRTLLLSLPEGSSRAQPRKRVQRYILLRLRQNLSATFYKKNEVFQGKNEKLRSEGNKMRNKECRERKMTHADAKYMRRRSVETFHDTSTELCVMFRRNVTQSSVGLS